jgi:hypothetical protein
MPVHRKYKTLWMGCSFLVGNATSLSWFANHVGEDSAIAQTTVGKQKEALNSD